MLDMTIASIVLVCLPLIAAFVLLLDDKKWDRKYKYAIIWEYQIKRLDP